MPRKKKKSKKQPPLIDYELSFSDVTLDSTSGEYKRVKHLMDTDDYNSAFTIIKNGKFIKVKSNPIDTEWCVKSRLSIKCPLGEGSYLLDFYHNKNVYIIDYGGSFDPMVNPDVRCLSSWCQQKGWNIPKVTQSVVKEELFFWKSLWETRLIDCEYLDEKYGKRKTSDMLKNQPEEDDDFI